MPSKKPVAKPAKRKPASERIKAFVAESSIPGSDAHRLDEAEAELQAEGAQLAVLNLRVDAIEKRMEKLRGEIQRLCPHHTTEDDSHYYSGNYNDRAETTHNLKCVRCGFSVKRWTDTHSWYG